MSNKVLLVVTSHNQIDESHPTGLWLEEFATPYKEFRRQGWDVTVASPQGGAAPIDPRSDEAKTEWTEARAALQNTLPLGQVKSEGYAAIFLPGGHGTMFDLPGNVQLQALLREFAESGRIVSAVCHGPAGLAGVTLSNGQPLVAGKKLTAFTDSEERAAQLDTLMPFLLESRLRQEGANFVTQPDWSDHVEQDGWLITGQNPQSSASVANAVIASLQAVAR